MKKFLLLTLGLGIFVVSCGTKESSMQKNSSDSASVRSNTVPPTKVDTVKIDSTAMPPATR
ncbi:cytochrome C551 [Chryseobacterium camelliae]|uniref:Cytochrome C551 n=1 Tax=Chryseobacterium camelliae TaxID=1265445 RepID=A0ABY7QNR8_9FLAO|nr:cytochrome C551 [Chryseobacterium camelliae]WBV61323.1 cytochrome C551 [Chryseobacterium camelliae]